MNQINPKLYFALLVLGVVAFLPGESSDCFATWKRCTGWAKGASSGDNNKEAELWKTCGGRCQLCGGRESGSCVLVNGECGARRQCVCSGGNLPTIMDYWTKMTCALGNKNLIKIMLGNVTKDELLDEMKGQLKEDFSLI